MGCHEETGAWQACHQPAPAHWDLMTSLALSSPQATSLYPSKMNNDNDQPDCQSVTQHNTLTILYL